jgi:hypothetical protein
MTSDQTALGNQGQVCALPNGDCELLGSPAAAETEGAGILCPLLTLKSSYLSRALPSCLHLSVTLLVPGLTPAQCGISVGWPVFRVDTKQRDNNQNKGSSVIVPETFESIADAQVSDCSNPH